MKFSNFKAKDIQREFNLSKQTSKRIQEANNFLKNQTPALQNLLKKHEQFLCRSFGKKKCHRNPLNIIDMQKMNSQRNDNQKKLQNSNFERQIISMHLKKYKPTNGSSTQIYEQKLSICDQKKPSKVDLNKIPQIMFRQNGMWRNIKSRKLTDHLANKKENSFELFAKQQKFNQINEKQNLYNNIANKIHEKTYILKQKSQRMLRKAEIACNLNEKSFSKLKEYSDRMMYGEEFDEDEFIFSQKRQLSSLK